jgi:hypothetical protein
MSGASPDDSRQAVQEQVVKVAVAEIPATQCIIAQAVADDHRHRALMQAPVRAERAMQRAEVVSGSGLAEYRSGVGQHDQVADPIAWQLEGFGGRLAVEDTLNALNACECRACVVELV